MHYFVAWWIGRHFPAIPALPLRLLPPLLAIATPGMLAALRHSHGKLMMLGSYCAYIWMGAIFIVFWTVLAGFIIEWLSGFAFGGEAANLWAARLVPACCAFFVLLALYGGFRKPALKHIEIPMKNLPAGMNGFKIGFFADMHMSAIMPVSHLLDTCDKLKAENPDLIIFGGDFVDPGFYDMALLRELSAQLKPPYGKYAVFGNHEYYYSVRGAQEVYDSFGLTTLHNDTAALSNGLQLAGIDDVRVMHITQEEADRVMDKLDPAKPSIFITHEPYFFEDAAKRGVGLALAGHTHAGQIFPFNLIISLTYKYIYGLYSDGDARFYVTSGSGWWGPPMRLFTRAEVVIITLTPK
jgi:hypothetical protein